MGRDTIQIRDLVSTISQEYLLEFTSEYGIPEFLHSELPGQRIRSLRPCVAHEVPLLTATASRVVDMEDPDAATESSGTSSTIEKSPLDFDNENPSQQITEGLEVGFTFFTPTPQETPADVSDLDPLLYAMPPSIPDRDIAQSSRGAAIAGDPDSEKSSSFTSELRHLPNDGFLGQHNMNLVRQVAMGSQLRLRFEKEGYNTNSRPRVHHLLGISVGVYLRVRHTRVLASGVAWPEDTIVDFSKGKVGVLRPCVAHEVPLLTATASRVVDMEDPDAATESSGTSSTIEKSPLDFDNENPSQQITEMLRKDHAASRPTQSTMGGKSLASTGLEAGFTFFTPTPQETPAGVSDLDPLLYAMPPSIPDRDIVQSSHGAAIAGDPDSEKSSSFTPGRQAIYISQGGV
nr:hypothetical protein [Tanacetum cinerariifolium]